MSKVPFPSARRRLKIQSPQIYNAVLDEVIETIKIEKYHGIEHIINKIAEMKAPDVPGNEHR